MTLAAGSRLGPYEIVSPVGAGGMGEVYKAKDTRLERTVAIKVLPSHLSASAEVRQRFEPRRAQERPPAILFLPLEADRKPQVFLKTPAFEYPAAFSPDGRWLAYGSDESGKLQISATSFPNRDASGRSPARRGAYAYWSADGKEILYHGFLGRIRAVDIAIRADSIEPGIPKALFKIPIAPKAGGPDIYPTADHQRFLYLDRGNEKSSSLLNLVVNWTAGSKR